jgi:tellurite resistance protein TehA-like permease
MDKKDLIWIILISVIAVIIISFAIPVLVKMPHPGIEQKPVHSQEKQQAQRPPAPPGQEETKQLKTLISFINIGLIIPLFIIYARIYRKLHSSFTLGLMAVVFALGMYAVTSNPLLVSLLGGRADYIGFIQIIPDLCTTAALIILVRISLE